METSEIRSSRSETEDIDFPFTEFEHLLDNFDNKNENCLIVQDKEWVPPPLTITSKRNIRCAQKSFNQPTLKLDDVEQNNITLELKSPLQYFSEYFDDDVFEKMAYHINLYAIQKGVTRFETFNRYSYHNGFFSLRNNLHIVDNNEIPNGNKDKFIKVRPLYAAVQKKCNSLPMERNLCVDEQMGIKVFLLCGESGTIYNILLFQGYYELDQDLRKTIGSGANVVLILRKTLQQLQIYATGTIRTNWFANPPLLSDKVMRKLGRGTTFEVTTDVPGCNIGIVKWFDNIAVNLGSNFIASGEVDRVTRWDKKEKQFVDIERTEIVRLYNKSMGGVDKLDQLISYYRIFIRSRKWTLRMIMHAFDMAISNCWIQYKKEADILKVPFLKLEILV
ncbi:hypothetical protein QTP88_010070 [Uroleucon formosanum]